MENIDTILQRVKEKCDEYLYFHELYEKALLIIATQNQRPGNDQTELNRIANLIKAESEAMENRIAQQIFELQQSLNEQQH